MEAVHVLQSDLPGQCGPTCIAGPAQSSKLIGIIDAAALQVLSARLLQALGCSPDQINHPLIKSWHKALQNRM